ncbi:DUF368 domain-containing protein [Nesterenkonia flava]|uniref:DUF368 domain-containing protein n=1 Tax=Nesterenkonia flava TaxID=469799 RepID=A0ABU1FQW1_9MICC|nr:DUF368 domain-containing protein [Nesterenkonia flava]MDR5711031.1 DUF368 domain-containing protein [Nesterenkonia flava]
MPQTSSPSSPEPAAPALDTETRAPEDRRTSLPGNVIRGALIGIVETVPGVSGGTVALVVGIYRQLISSASSVVSAVRALLTGTYLVDGVQSTGRAAGFKHYVGQVHWRIIVPVMIGMLVGLFTAVQFVGGWIEDHPELTRAAFFGMVLASIAVPVRMAGRVAAGHVIAGLAAAAVTFWLVSLPPNHVEPHWWIVLPAAAVAVSALLLPGLSGSFLLLTFGLYEPTIDAARTLDLGYLGIFAVGMVIGLVVIVKGLKWLLDHYHQITLVVLSGVMLGALRTLWPWQTEDRDLQAPGDDVGLILAVGAAGFVVVAILVVIDARLAARSARRTV